MAFHALIGSLITMSLLGPTPQDAADRLLQAADLTFGARQYADAREQYRKASEQAEKDGNQAALAESLAQVARCFSIEGKLEEGRPWLDRAEKTAAPSEPRGWSRCLGVRGIFQREAGDKAKAKATFEEMHRYCVDKGLDRRAIDAIHHLAIVVPPEEQPGWALKGIAAAERLKDDAALAVLWNNLGATYEDLKKYDRMVEAYLQARTYHHRSGGPIQKMIADWAVGHGYRLSGKLDEAEQWLRKTLPKAEDLRKAEWIGWCKKDLGEVLLAKGRKPEGVLLLQEARKLLVDAGLEQSWPEALRDIDETIRSNR